MKPYDVWLEACAVAGMILLSLALISPPFICIFVFHHLGWFGGSPDSNAAGAAVGMFVSLCIYAWALCKAGMEV